MKPKSAAHWTSQPEIKRIIKEVADELDVTPGDVLGVIVHLFKTVKDNIVSKKVKMFTLPYWGRINQIGYLSRRVISLKATIKKNKRAQGIYGERAPDVHLEGDKHINIS